MIPFVLGLLLGAGLHRAWSELRWRAEERWFSEHREGVRMVLRTMARRN